MGEGVRVIESDPILKVTARHLLTMNTDWKGPTSEPENYFVPNPYDSEYSIFASNHYILHDAE